MQNSKVQYYIYAVLALIIAGLLFWVNLKDKELNKLRDQNYSLEQKTLKDGTVRSSSSYASKEDIEKIIKESGINISDLKKDLDDLNSEIKGVQRVVALSNGSIVKNTGSTSTSPGKEPDGTVVKPPMVECNGTQVSCPNPYGHFTNKQNLKLVEDFNGKKVDIGDVSFSAWREKPWDYQIYPRQYKLTTVVATDENGKISSYNKMIVSSNGVDTDVPIAQSSFKEQFPSSSFRFNPRLYMGVDAGVSVYSLKGILPSNIGQVTPNLQLALFSYGRTKLDVEWIFLGLGVGFDGINKNFSLLLSPLAYNVGKPIPFVENLFFGPSVSLDADGNIGVLLGARVGL